jgi:LuxR family transcriptional regulator, maltose regulon positive regulatory protein
MEMSEPGAAPKTDALLATKLYVPRVPPGFVARPRLTGPLDEAGRLILVCAPAGFGKTALLAAWASAGPRPVAWLSLDEGDNDPARFWRHVAAALDRVRPGVSGRVGPLLGPQSSEAVVTALLNDLAERPVPGQALLVLDDYHLIAARQVHDAVQFLLDHLPNALRLVLATRADPPLRLSRLRARGELTELRAADLRFTETEAAALLRGTPAGRGLTGAAVDALTAKTEGWPAGLALAGLSLKSRDDTDAFVAAFSGSHRYVLDYLAEEVLDGQDPQVRSFLLETSVLSRLTGDLCDAVTGRPGGQAMLERIERAGLFLLPLDEVRGWWRYHHLFADLLQARLAAEQPDRVPALHRAAAAWHAGHGLPDDAIRHALAANERELAADLVERHFDAVYFTGENATVQRWLSALPADLDRSRPRIALARAFLALTAGDIDAAERAVAALPADPAQAGDDFRPSVGAGGSFIVNVPAAAAIARAWLAFLRGDAEDMAGFAARAQARLRDGERTLASICRLNLALADWLRGRLDAAGERFTAAIAEWQAAGQLALAAQGWNYLGQIRRAQGNLDTALDAYHELLRITERPDGTTSPVAGIGHVGLAEVACQRGDLAAARRELDTGLPLCRQTSDTLASAAGLATLAWIRQAEGDQAGARRAMAEAGQAGPSEATSGLLNPVPAQRARLALAQCDVAAAARWVRQQTSPDREPAYPTERDQLVLARLLLAQDRPDQALGLLAGLAALARRQGRAGSVIEISALRALALAAAGQAAAAAQDLAGTLALAASQGYVRVFADEGPPMAALLAQVAAAHRDGDQVARRVPLGYLAAVLRACPPPGQAPKGQTPKGQTPAGQTPAGQTPVPGLAEPLTARETQVLHLLASGAPNQRIAGDLVVTLDTVKKHITHVLGKLGAANRTEAVTRARQLGLIP